MAPDVRNGNKPRLTISNMGEMWEAAQRFWRKSYAGDYIGLALLFAGFVIVKMLGEPFHQQFTLGDTRIQHAYAEVQQVDTCTCLQLDARAWLTYCPLASLAIRLCRWSSAGVYRPLDATLLPRLPQGSCYDPWSWNHHFYDTPPDRCPQGCYRSSTP